MLAKYDKFCEELGVNQGACRGCVPVVKFDPEKEPKSTKSQDKTRQNSTQASPTTKSSLTNFSGEDFLFSGF
ncbi:Uncharacterised protein [Actinobacillus equuli]|nr:Uncharacterised protein [Actinobacillus equuli]